jgi:Restriction endonuclease S subunits
MTPEQLKASILQRAMEGKLVPQDPNDEPASELLKRIKVEKEKLIKEGKIKRDKNETEIFRGDDGLHYEKFGDGTVKEVEVPYEIPDSWTWSRFRNLMFLISGRDLKPSQYSDKVAEGIPYLTGASNFNNGKLLSQRWTTEPQVISTDGDILISVKGTIGELAINSFEKAHIARQIMAIKPVSIETSYVLYFLESNVNRLKTEAQSIIPGISRDVLLNTLFPVPPASEQARIVKKIIEIYLQVIPYVKNYNKLIALNKEFPEKLRKSILQYAMRGKLVPQDPNDEPVEVLLEKIRTEKQKLFKEGKLKKKDLQESIIYKGDDNSYYEKKGKTIEKIDDVREIPDNWRWVKFGDCLALISGRDLKASEFQNNIIGKIPYLTGATNFNAGKISTSRSTDCASVISLKNDLMITVKGTIGEMAFNPFDEVHIARQIMAIRPYLDNINMKYIQLFLDSEIINIQSKAQSMIPGISREVLLSLNIPVPSKNEQDRVIIQVEKFYLQIDQFLLQSYAVPLLEVLE